MQFYHPTKTKEPLLTLQSLIPDYNVSFKHYEHYHRFLYQLHNCRPRHLPWISFRGVIISTEAVNTAPSQNCISVQLATMPQ